MNKQQRYMLGITFVWLAPILFATYIFTQMFELQSSPVDGLTKTQEIFTTERLAEKDMTTRDYGDGNIYYRTSPNEFSLERPEWYGEDGQPKLTAEDLEERKKYGLVHTPPILMINKPLEQRAYDNLWFTMFLFSFICLTGCTLMHVLFQAAIRSHWFGLVHVITLVSLGAFVSYVSLYADSVYTTLATYPLQISVLTIMLTGAFVGANSILVILYKQLDRLRAGTSATATNTIVASG